MLGALLSPEKQIHTNSREDWEGTSGSARIPVAILTAVTIPELKKLLCKCPVRHDENRYCNDTTQTHRYAWSTTASR